MRVREGQGDAQCLKQRHPAIRSASRSASAPARRPRHPKAARTQKEIREAIEHRTLAMTNRYTHLAPTHLRGAFAVLDGVLDAPQNDAVPSCTAEKSRTQLSRPV